MPLPEPDLVRVNLWIERLNAEMPAHVLSQLRYETEVYRNAVTLVECRLVDLDQPGGDWFRIPFARLRFTRSRGWELYCADGNSEFHVYDLVPPADDVDVLLAEISEDPTCIVFG
ncbi:DUF3024 domain-containing protein [Mycobacterium sp. shizuoka-1]|uniref:DUF3024 domain-containing protein n=1 Tax=Mycobacterium sp. shizuoka-1 TaxID=2039281 RepID=UPI000C05D4F8|nr:DUF3024 domain-containing protein [Mycobacterium sp. shizuoka-1]GAY14630.1 hypothetical protein MSZK_13560 [Mycobacterium sp. shizuoka-1]